MAGVQHRVGRLLFFSCHHTPTKRPAPSLAPESLYSSANAGRDATESGTRHARICSQIRSHLGADTSVSGTAYAEKS